MLSSLILSSVVSLISTIELNGLSQLKALDVPIVLVTDFTDEAAKKFATEMKAAKETGIKLIVVEIDSYGGRVYSLLGMVSTLKSIQDSGVKVATFVGSKAMSAGSVLFACGSEGLRFASPYATIMIHYVASSASGKIPDLIVDVNEADRLNTLLFSLLDKSAGKPDGFFMGLVKGKGGVDWFLTSKEAMDLGLVSKIRVPEVKTKITAEGMIE